MGRPFKIADILRLALDGQLELSVNLPTGMIGNVRRIDDPQDRVVTEPIDGLWELPLTGAARRQVEHQYHLLLRLPDISMENTKGAIVVRDNLLSQLTPQRGATGFYSRLPSAFPEGCVLVVRTAVLDAFAAMLTPSPVTGTAEDANRSLATRERTTLLTIIAGFCKHAKIDVSKPSAASVAIEVLTQEINAGVSARTIEDHLRSIPDALERRGKLLS